MKDFFRFEVWAKRDCFASINEDKIFCIMIYSLWCIIHGIKIFLIVMFLTKTKFKFAYFIFSED